MIVADPISIKSRVRKLFFKSGLLSKTSNIPKDVSPKVTAAYRAKRKAQNCITTLL